MGKEFNLNIGASEDAGKGKGSSGFGFKHTINMKKAVGKHLTGTDVMSDGYYNQVNKVEGIEDGGSGINMNVPAPTYLSETPMAFNPPEIDLEKSKQAGELDKAFKNIDKNIKSSREKIQDKDVIHAGIKKSTWADKSRIYRGGRGKKHGNVSHEQARAYQTYKDNAEANKRRVGEGNVYDD